MNILLCLTDAQNERLLSILYLVAIMFIPVFLWCLYTSFKVKYDFNKYSKVNSKAGIPAYQVARMILDSEGLTNVQVGICNGNLTDHYDPRSNVVMLSNSVYNSSSVAAIGVAAHEVGHAIQHANNYIPVKARGFLVPVLNFSSKLLLPILLLNIVLTFLVPINRSIPMLIYFILLGIYGLNMIFALVTLPCEFNASSRAKDILEDLNIMDDGEIKLVSKVLRSAAMTYVASFVLTIIQMARILLVLFSSRRRK